MPGYRHNWDLSVLIWRVGKSHNWSYGSNYQQVGCTKQWYKRHFLLTAWKHTHTYHWNTHTHTHTHHSWQNKKVLCSLLGPCILGMSGSWILIWDLVTNAWELDLIPTIRVLKEFFLSFPRLKEDTNISLCCSILIHPNCLSDNNKDQWPVTSPPPPWLRPVYPTPTPFKMISYIC